MIDERWRCFVAIPLSEALRAALRTAIESWRVDEDLQDLRWTEPDRWHVTVAFLGSIEAASVPEVTARLEAAASRHAVMQAATGGLGAFPSAAQARVAWYGIEDPEGGLARLGTDVALALGLDASRPYHPHLTLARARRQPVDLRSWLATASVPDGRLTVDRIELMRSHLGSGSVRYERLRAITLGVRAGV